MLWQIQSSFSLQPSEENLPKLPAAIIESNLLVDSLDLLHIFWAQLKIPL